MSFVICNFIYPFFKLKLLTAPPPQGIDTETSDIMNSWTFWAVLDQTYIKTLLVAGLAPTTVRCKVPQVVELPFSRCCEVPSRNTDLKTHSHVITRSQLGQFPPRAMVYFSVISRLSRITATLFCHVVHICEQCYVFPSTGALDGRHRQQWSISASHFYSILKQSIHNLYGYLHLVRGVSWSIPEHQLIHVVCWWCRMYKTIYHIFLPDFSSSSR